MRGAAQDGSCAQRPKEGDAHAFQEPQHTFQVHICRDERCYYARRRGFLAYFIKLCSMLAIPAQVQEELGRSMELLRLRDDSGSGVHGWFEMTASSPSVPMLLTVLTISEPSRAASTTPLSAAARCGGSTNGQTGLQALLPKSHGLTWCF